MNADDGNVFGPEEELQLLEQEITQVAATAVELRKRLGQREDEPADPEERAASLTAAEEQEAILATLEQRHRDLLGHLARSHRQ